MRGGVGKPLLAAAFMFAATAGKAGAQPADSGARGSRGSSDSDGSSGSGSSDSVAPASDAPTPPPGVTIDPEAGGTHLRVSTPLGPVHLFKPPGYDRRTAGVVVYVHGHYVTADGAWKEHALAQQFVASRRNALFVVPEAPSSGEEKSAWPRLRRLLTTSVRQAHLELPRGPLVVAGHSGAYRTIVPWLKESALHHVILLDALYGNQQEFRAWLRKDRANQLTLATKGTAKWADPFVRALPYARTVGRIPDRLDQIARRDRTARVLALRSQYGHFELITEGKVLPLLLGRTPLQVVRRQIPARPL